MKFKYLTVFFYLFYVVCFAALPCMAQGNGIAQYRTSMGPGELELGLNQRFRYEYLDGFNVKTYGTDGDDQVLLSRTRIHLRYALEDGPVLMVQGQDSRFWLSDDIDKDDFPLSCPYHNDFDLRQAFVEWRRAGGTPLGFKAGRQSIGYGDNRIFGAAEWGNVGRHLWDGVIGSYNMDAVKVDLIYARKILFDWDAYDRHHTDDHVYAAYAQAKPCEGHDVDAFYVVRDSNDPKGPDDDHTIQTAGVYGKGGAGPADYSGTFAWQFGDDGGDDVAAYMVHADAGWTVDLIMKPRISAGYTLGSGDNDPNDGERGTYDGVFGGVASYYGRMNLFSGSNLEDCQVGVSAKPCKGVSLSLDYHRFYLAGKKDGWYYCNNKVMHKDATGRSGSHLGEETDLICSYKVNPHLKLMAGYAFFMPGRFVENAGWNDTAHWAFTQVTLAF